MEVYGQNFKYGEDVAFVITTYNAAGVLFGYTITTEAVSWAGTKEEHFVSDMYKLGQMGFIPDGEDVKLDIAPKQYPVDDCEEEYGVPFNDN